MGQMPAQNNVSMIDALPNMMQQEQGSGNGLSNFQQQAIQTSFMESMEPMAANGALGGSFGAFILDLDFNILLFFLIKILIFFIE